MTGDDVTVGELRARVAEFVAERSWERFHTPRDLAAAIAIEAGELQELLLWKTASEIADGLATGEVRENFCHELADILIYSLSLANALDIDIQDVVSKKMRLNAKKYPAGTGSETR